MPESSRRRQRAEKRTGSVSGTHRPDRAGNNPRRRQRNCRGSGQGRNPAPHKTGTLGTLHQSPTTAPPQSPTTVPPAARHCSLSVLLLCGLFVFPSQSPAPVLHRANHALPFSPPVPVPRPVSRRPFIPLIVAFKLHIRYPIFRFFVHTAEKNGSFFFTKKQGIFSPPE